MFAIKKTGSCIVFDHCCTIHDNFAIIFLRIQSSFAIVMPQFVWIKENAIKGYRTWENFAWMSETHCTLLPWKDEYINNKETDWFPTTQPLLNPACLMAVTWYASRSIWFMCHYSHNPVSMAVAIWRQDISNHHDNLGQSVDGRSAPA